MRDRDPDTITDRNLPPDCNVPPISSEWSRLRPREETMSEPTSSYAGTQTKTCDTESASVTAEPLAKAHPTAQRQEPEATRQSV